VELRIGRIRRYRRGIDVDQVPLRMRRS
jgi:hypothetical protein